MLNEATPTTVIRRIDKQIERVPAAASRSKAEDMFLRNLATIKWLLKNPEAIISAVDTPDVYYSGCPSDKVKRIVRGNDTLGVHVSYFKPGEGKKANRHFLNFFNEYVIGLERCDHRQFKIAISKVKTSDIGCIEHRLSASKAFTERVCSGKNPTFDDVVAPIASEIKFDTEVAKIESFIKIAQAFCPYWAESLQLDDEKEGVVSYSAIRKYAADIYGDNGPALTSVISYLVQTKKQFDGKRIYYFNDLEEAETYAHLIREYLTQFSADTSGLDPIENHDNPQAVCYQITLSETQNDFLALSSPPPKARPRYFAAKYIDEKSVMVAEAIQFLPLVARDESNVVAQLLLCTEMRYADFKLEQIDKGNPNKTIMLDKCIAFKFSGQDEKAAQAKAEKALADLQAMYAQDDRFINLIFSIAQAGMLYLSPEMVDALKEHVLPRVHPQNFIIKTIATSREDGKNWPSIVGDLTRSIHDTRPKAVLRSGDPRRFVYKANGVQDRATRKPNNPLYRKQTHSSRQSVSICHGNELRPAVAISRQGVGILVGCDNNVIIDGFFKYGNSAGIAGTCSRVLEAGNKTDAEREFHRNKKFMFTTAQAFVKAFPKGRCQKNEALGRIRWGYDAKVLLFDDERSSRLQALARALSIADGVKRRAREHHQLVPVGYTPDIYLYKSGGDYQQLPRYTWQQQQNDLEGAFYPSSSSSSSYYYYAWYIALKLNYKAVAEFPDNLSVVELIEKLATLIASYEDNEMFIPLFRKLSSSAMNTVCKEAIKCKNPDLLALLLEANVSDSPDSLIAHMASGDAWVCLPVFVKKLKNPGSHTLNRLLEYACRNQQWDLVEDLLARGATISGLNYSGQGYRAGNLKYFSLFEFFIFHEKFSLITKFLVAKMKHSVANGQSIFPEQSAAPAKGELLCIFIEYCAEKGDVDFLSVICSQLPDSKQVELPARCGNALAHFWDRRGVALPVASCPEEKKENIVIFAGAGSRATVQPLRSRVLREWPLIEKFIMNYPKQLSDDAWRALLKIAIKTRDPNIVSAVFRESRHRPLINDEVLLLLIQQREWQLFTEGFSQAGTEILFTRNRAGKTFFAEAIKLFFEHNDFAQLNHMLDHLKGFKELTFDSHTGKVLISLINHQDPVRGWLWLKAIIHAVPGWPSIAIYAELLALAIEQKQADMTALITSKMPDSLHLRPLSIADKSALLKVAGCLFGADSWGNIRQTASMAFINSMVTARPNLLFESEPQGTSLLGVILDKCVLEESVEPLSGFLSAIQRASRLPLSQSLKVRLRDIATIDKPFAWHVIQKFLEQTSIQKMPPDIGKELVNSISSGSDEAADGRLEIFNVMKSHILADVDQTSSELKDAFIQSAMKLQQYEVAEELLYRTGKIYQPNEREIIPLNIHFINMRNLYLHEKGNTRSLQRLDKAYHEQRGDAGDAHIRIYRVYASFVNSELNNRKTAPNSTSLITRFIALWYQDYPLGYDYLDNNWNCYYMAKARSDVYHKHYAVPNFQLDRNFHGGATFFGCRSSRLITKASVLALSTAAGAAFSLCVVASLPLASGVMLGIAAGVALLLLDRLINLVINWCCNAVNDVSYQSIDRAFYAAV